MGLDAIFFETNEAMLVSVAAMLCGIALLHLVMIRMIRKRSHRDHRRNFSGGKRFHAAQPPVFSRRFREGHGGELWRVWWRGRLKPALWATNLITNGSSLRAENASCCVHVGAKSEAGIDRVPPFFGIPIAKNQPKPNGSFF